MVAILRGEEGRTENIQHLQDDLINKDCAVITSHNSLSLLLLFFWEYDGQVLICCANPFFFCSIHILLFQLSKLVSTVPNM